MRGGDHTPPAEHGYDKKTQGQAMGQILAALKVEKAGLVTHDIGNMGGYAFVASIRIG
jgi:hypothetical protein